jgi:ferredoxin
MQAAASMPAADPVPVVSYRSQGRLLIVGEPAMAMPWARLLADTLQVSVLAPALDTAPAMAGITLLQGELVSLSGWLGAFELQWAQGSDNFDLVLDLQDRPLFDMHLPPQGYFRVAEDAMSAAYVAKELVQAVGEFEKPKYFAYDEKLCAHSRSRLEGCNRCIDVCSTVAISSFGDKVKVEPHLCMGCGACASVCPSGAMRYNYPSVAYSGERLKLMLATYNRQVTQRPTVLIHAESATGSLLADTRQPLSGVIPYAVHDVASIGLDLYLYAIAAGASRVLVAAPASEAPQYLQAISEQMQLAETLLHGLGYAGEHYRLVQDGSLDAALEADSVPGLPATVAVFNPFNEKRTTLEFCIDHLAKHAPAVLPESIALPAGAPFGEVKVDASSCTLCMSCVSACPVAALRDTPGQPMLKFVERNCLQCGLCEATCPEDAIRLQPRLLLTAEATQPRTLHEDKPFHCVSCGKVFGTTRMVENMAKKLDGHSMFATPEAKRRLSMCGDCRVIDMMGGGR